MNNFENSRGEKEQGILSSKIGNTFAGHGTDGKREFLSIVLEFPCFRGCLISEVTIIETKNKTIANEKEGKKEC